jgi:UDP-N-acetylmuramoyl-tripeptide--D-alanyl-D-alanine ligase
MRATVKKIIVTLLLIEAKLVIKKYKPRIIVITGSVGKTSTKDAIYAVVSNGTHVRKSEKSFNSEIGVPLTILGVPNAWNNPLVWLQNLADGLFLVLFKNPYPEWLVLEIGADHPGDIRGVASWLPVDIAVITRVPDVPVHVEFFDSPEEVLEEKASIIGALKKDGVLVLYADDERTRNLAPRADGRRVITYGMSEDAYVHIDNPTPTFGSDGYPIGMNAQITVEGVTAPIEVVGTVGTHVLLAALAGVAVGLVFKKSISEMTASLKNHEPPAGRMRLLRGINSSLIIDDTYNSSPAAVEAALETLSYMGTQFGAHTHHRGRKIAVLGDMLELGRHSVYQHRKLGEMAAKKATILVTVGFRAGDMAVGALDAKMKQDHVTSYREVEFAIEPVAAMIKPGDTILVKGSQGMRLERVVKRLLEKPEEAKTFLVRQGEEWEKR